MKTLIMLFALAATSLSAADITGTWKGVAKVGNSTLKRTFVFKQDGTKLTGKTISDRWGSSAIESGEIEGDALSFNIVVDIEFGKLKVSFTGKVQGDVINMTADTNGSSTVDFTAKRATSK